jgi:hypothetical protein
VPLDANKNQFAVAAAIADLNTGTATTTQIATAVNAILAALRAAGVIST